MLCGGIVGAPVETPTDAAILGMPQPAEPETAFVIFAKLRDRYDCVLLDCGALAESVDLMPAGTRVRRCGPRRGSGPDRQGTARTCDEDHPRSAIDGPGLCSQQASLPNSSLALPPPPVV